MRIFIIFIWLFSACVLADESNYLKIGILDGGWPPYQQVTMEIPSGFSVDLINQLIEGVGFQPKWKIYHSWNAVKDALCRGDIDIIIDAFGNSNKGCVALTRSYHRSPYVLVVNPNSVFFENVDQVNEARIAVEEGFLLDEAFSSYYPGAKKIRVSDTFSALQAVKNDRADVYVGNKDVSYFLTQRHDDLIVAAQASVFIDSLRFGVSRDNSRLLEMINDAIDAFPRRKMAELEKKWFSFQHEFIGHSAVLLRPNERKLLKSFPPIKLVWDEKNSPLSFLNFKGKPEGVGKDYIDVLTRDLGIHFSYYSYNEIEVAHVFEASSFDAMIIPKRRVPALSQWVVSDKLFSVPVVIASKESDDFIVDDKLDNKRIIFSDYQLLNELDLPCEKLNYEVSNDVYTSLKKISQGDFDVYIGDLAAINRVLKNNTQLDIEVTKKTEVVNDYVLAVHDRYANLVPLVNRSVRAMKEWERENILNKWVSVRTFQDINWLEAVKKLLPFLIVALSGMVIASVGYWRLKKLLTYKNKIEADLKLAREKAEKYAQVKEDFLAKMSHEIRTPIHGIIGMLEQISMTKLNFEQTQMVGVASSSASSLYNIVSEVLDYSKLEAGKVEVELRPFLLCNLLDNILDIGSYEAKNKKLILKVHLDSKLKPMYEGDQYLLQQVMTNILNNALKFTSEGSVIITLEVVSIDDDRHTLRIGVRDSGLGMSEEEITRIFDPFEQAERSTTRRFGGTGLGLTICQQLVELMSGEIIIESEKGKGSWVGFTLPLKVIEKTHTEEKLEGCCVNVDIKDPILRTSLITNLISLGIKVANDDSLKTFSDHNDDAEVKLVPLSGMVGVRRENHQWLLNSQPITNKSVKLVCYELLGIEEDKAIKIAFDSCSHIRILVVEDNDVNQMLVSYQLTQIGVAFDIADNGHEALSFLSENDYTLVICDCHMPYMDGYQLSKQIRSGHSIYKDIPIIAMTADVLNDQRERCLRAGMNDLLSKPIRIDQLRDTLWRWGLFDNNGLDVEQLRGSFGGVDVLVEMLRAANTSLESGLMVPVDADERVDWVHKHTGTVALLGLTSLEKYGAFVETKLQENVELDEYRHYRAKLFLLMRQLGCLIAHMNNEKSDG